MTEKPAISARRPAPEDTLLSVVLPVFNESAILETLVDAVEKAIAPAHVAHELIFVNDGSSDESGAILDRLAQENKNLKVVHFSRNFGHQPAVLAGLDYAEGDCVVVMDSDMQDDPGCFPELLEKWREGYDVVYAVRFGRKEGPLKKALFFAFYRFLNAISQTPMPNDAGNFGLVDKKVCRAIRELAERDRYFAGLRQWVGFKQTGVPVERGERYDENARVSMLGLFRLAKSAIFSFSNVPLAVFYLLAGLSGTAFVGLGAFTLYHRLFTGLAIPGWTSIIMTGCFFGAVNSLGIAILGEYVTRIYDQVRARPLYLVARTENVGATQPKARVPDEESTGTA